MTWSWCLRETRRGKGEIKIRDSHDSGSLKKPALPAGTRRGAEAEEMLSRKQTHSFQKSPWPERVHSAGTPGSFAFVFVLVDLPAHHAGCGDKRPEAKEPGGLRRRFLAVHPPCGDRWRGGAGRGG